MNDATSATLAFAGTGLGLAAYWLRLRLEVARAEALAPTATEKSPPGNGGRA